MEFHENKAKAPFIGLVQLWQAVRRWRRQMQTRRVLQQMSDERLRILGYAGRMWSEGMLRINQDINFYMYQEETRVHIDIS